MSGYPLTLLLEGRPVLVVGGGRVAARRIPGLLAAGALVRVVSPRTDPALDAALADAMDAGNARVVARVWRPGDAGDARLVLACTDDPAVNAAVAAEADAARVPCVRADDAAGGTAVTPATVTTAGVQVAVTAGEPVRARRIRDAVALLLDTGALPLRRTRAGTGCVALVGGGPGDPGLLTVRGRRLLAEADVVVADRLGPTAEVLAGLDPDVEIVDVGKRPGERGAGQEEINRLLVEHALAGRRVVRLKGGDPFVFGRGGEEVLACRAAGVAVEVVSGVTSAVAVPASAGIPVTHRGVSHEVVVATAHLDPDDPANRLDWERMAGTGRTLVLLMAFERIERIATALVAAGRDPATPAAVISEGTTPNERVVTGPLDGIAARVRDAGLRAPAVVVIGDVVALRDQIAGRRGT